MKINKKVIFTVLVSISTLYVNGQDNRFNQKNPDKPEVTEYMDPEIKVITPGAIPSDALVLFDGKNLDQWESTKDGGAAKWKVEDGSMTVVGGAGGISTKKLFADCQLHIEWRSPIEGDDKKGQGKGNSGVFLQGIYEVQVLNSYNNRTYRNGQAGSIYKQSPPLVNVTSKMGEWNVYDIIYTAPKFTVNGGVEVPPFVTVIHNGVVVQNHTMIQGVTNYIGQPTNPVHGKAPIHLQDHGNAVSFRNVWIREL
jgi:hypothetical protein